MTPERYALYFVPDEGAPWAQAAVAWLGWDMVAGRKVPHPHLPGITDRISALTAVPRRYGLHATIKPPFRLAPGKNRRALERAIEDLTETLEPVSLDGLSVTAMGRFLALTPVGQTIELNAMAARTVRELDAFRAQPSQQEIARRRTAPLTPAQEGNLLNWGYPYVLESFRFHITLTSRLPKEGQTNTQAALSEYLGGLLPSPFILGDLALVGEDAEGFFHLLRRFPLTG